jgi:predicted dehydrogenase
VFAAVRAKDIFIIEAMWTRFTPLVLILQKKLFEEKVIGDVRRTFCDFSLDMDIAPLGIDSRLKSPGLGAGSLLDIGIYSLTRGLLTLDARIGEQAEKPNVVAVQALSDQIDIGSSVLLQYPSTGRQDILTSTTESKTDRAFCRIEGTQGYIIVEGIAASAPDTFIVYSKNPDSAKGNVSGMTVKPNGEVFKFNRVDMGFYWEADAGAVDIVEGKRENAIMPHAETLRLMKDFRRNQKTRRSKISSG